jgi:regulator of sigma E protease
MANDTFQIVLFCALIMVFIVVHELGHFAAAKIFGVRVDVVSIGFGPSLLQWRWGDTYWRLSAILFGGYTKLAGEYRAETTGNDPQYYLSKPRWVRLVIGLMGAGANAIASVVLLAGMYFWLGDQLPVYQMSPAFVGWVDLGSPAAQAGITVGDRVSRIGGLSNPTWRDIEEILGGHLKTGHT